MYLARVILLTVVAATSAKQFKFEPGLTWSCIKGRCDKNPPGTSPYLKKYPQEVCRLICGKYGPLWPHPTGPTILGEELVLFSPHEITFSYYFKHETEKAKKYLRKVSRIFRRRLISDCKHECIESGTDSVKVFFEVDSESMVLDWKTDESYHLEVTELGDSVHVKIKSQTVFGARHGLETLGQLITTSKVLYEDIWKRGMLMVSSVAVSDAPYYKHRGFMLNTARNFFSVKTILKTIDAMAMTKLNTFHWEVLSSQSFPLYIPSIPEMTKYGAYSLEKVYHKEDVKKVIRYAKLRGIRVIFALNLPSFTSKGWQWGPIRGLGSLALCVTRKLDKRYCFEAPCGVLNPVNPNVYSIIKKIFSYLISLLPEGEVFHVGSGYIDFNCWNSTREIVNWMAEKKIPRDFKGFLQVLSFCHKNILKAFDEANSVKNVSVILFNNRLTIPDGKEKYLDEHRYVIETWDPENSSSSIKFMKKGYKLIMAPTDKWRIPISEEVDIGRVCRESYRYKLPNHVNVLGGEILMVSARKDDCLLDSQIWPVTATTAERLWSNPNTSYDEALPRLMRLRDTLIKRGIRASPVAPYFCNQYEGKC